jgi:5'-nucleotidase / UDP-sugar diphosphatase
MQKWMCAAALLSMMTTSFGAVAEAKPRSHRSSTHRQSAAADKRAIAAKPAAPEAAGSVVAEASPSPTHVETQSATAQPPASTAAAPVEPAPAAAAAATAPVSAVPASPPVAERAAGVPQAEDDEIPGKHRRK